MDKLQDGYAALKLSYGVLSYSFGVLETAVEKNTGKDDESIKHEPEEIREEVKKSDNQFCFTQERHVSAESVAKIKDALLQDITSRLSAN
jgi:hypothetical protein